MEQSTGAREDTENDSTKCSGLSPSPDTETAGHPKHFIILVRHGERCDDPEREIRSENDSNEPKVKFDCHLTDKGKSQGFMTGEYIRQAVIEGNKIKLKDSDVKVFCSPFLRCIQTMSELVDGLGFLVQNVNIDDRLGEFMLKSWFEGVEKPLSHLTINHIKQKKFQADYLGKESKFKFTRYYGKDATPDETDVNVEDEKGYDLVCMESNKSIKYPETYSDMYYRYSEFINEIIHQEFFENAKDICNKSKLVILISHGFSFDPFINAFSPDHPQIISVDYCAVCISEKLSNDDRFELITKGDATHCGLKGYGY